MNSNHIAITRITKADAQLESLSEQLRKLSSEWQKNQEFWTLESCLESIRTHPGIFSASATIDPETTWSGWYLASYHDDHAELLFIFTSDTQRGKGIARVLLQDLIRRLTDITDVNTLSLEVRPSNHAAIKLYESAGFKIISRRKNYYKNGEDALVYQLNIRN